jgi:hypothetical protein
MRVKKLFINILNATAIALLIGGVMGFSGCRTVQYSEMSPTGALPRLLPPLETEIDMLSLESVFGATITSGSVSDLGFYEDVTYANPLLRDIVTVYERDMRNIAEEYGRTRGRAVCRLVDGEVGGGGYGWVFISGITMFVPNLIGVPFATAKASMQLEMSMFDNNGLLIGRYTSEYRKGRVPVALYYGYDGGDALLKVSLDVFKACMADIKKDIELDYSRLSGALEAAASANPLPTPGTSGAAGEPTLRAVW